MLHSSAQRSSCADHLWLSPWSWSTSSNQLFLAIAIYWRKIILLSAYFQRQTWKIFIWKDIDCIDFQWVATYCQWGELGVKVLLRDEHHQHNKAPQYCSMCVYSVMYSEICYAGTFYLLDNMCWAENNYQMLFLYFQFLLGHPWCSGVLQLSFQM